MHRESRLTFAALCILLVPLCTGWKLADPGLRFNSSPLAPEYRVHPDASATLRICFNRSCARTQTVTFTPDEIARVIGQMAVCAGPAKRNWLQRLRIAMWQMELPAQKYQPALANDLPVNSQEVGAEGRKGFVDNAANTTAFLRILEDMGTLPGRTTKSPRVRMSTSITCAHRAAVVVDQETGEQWSVASWYRANGHLPFVVPFEDWLHESPEWEPPFDRMDPYPLYKATSFAQRLR